MGKLLKQLTIADGAVRRSSRANKGQHSRFEKRKKVDIVEDDDGEIRCLCGDNVDDGGFMIQCERCGKWQHGECMGYEDADEVNDSYACELCRPDLYKEVPVKDEKDKAKVIPKKETTRPVLHTALRKLIRKKSTKRKAPPSEDESDDASDFSDDDNKPLIPSAPQKKLKTSPELHSPPPRTSISHEVKKKPPPINTARRPSQASPQQRRTSASSNPPTPLVLTKTAFAVSTFEDLSDQKRVPVARIFAKIFEPLDAKKSEALGLAIEHALYNTYATSEAGYGAEYKNRFRSISFNLKDPKNSALRERVLTGDLPPEQLVKLTNEQLANQELREQAEKAREEGLAQSVLKVQTGPRIRRTHKGEEIVGEELPVATPTLANVAAPFARADEASPSVKEDEAPSTPRSIASQQSRSLSPTSKPESHETKARDRHQSTSSNFAIQNVWERLRSPTPLEEEEPRRESIAIDEFTADIPENQIDDPDIDRLLGEEEPPYSPTAYDIDLPTTSAQSPPIWKGDLSMSSVAQFSAEARFVGGPNNVTDLPWSKILPSHLVVDGRIAIDTTTKYLAAQRSSSTKDVIVIQLDAADDSQKDMLRKLYQYFHDRQRYGVMQIQSNIVKDAYLIPLAPTEPIPEQIELMDSHDLPRSRTDPFLLAVLVIQKNVSLELHQSPPVTQSPSVVPPATNISPPTSASNQFSAATTGLTPSFSPSVAQPTAATGLETLGLSPADLAALQTVLLAHPEILSNPQILTNPSILQNLIQQYLGGRQW
jgi:Transcription factor S-II (TFIIS), central domain/SPOC domain/PHD-finger